MKKVRAIVSLLLALTLALSLTACGGKTAEKPPKPRPRQPLRRMTAITSPSS